MDSVQLSEGDALVSRLAELPAEELLRAWESLTLVVARRAADAPAALTSAPDGGHGVDGRLDALLVRRREFEQAAQVAQRVSRQADAALHLVAGAHHASVEAYDRLTTEGITESRMYPVEAGEFAAASLGVALAISTPAARAMADVSRALRRRHSRLATASIEGECSIRVAGMLADEMSHLGDDDASRVESALIVGGVHRRSHQAARERCRTVLRQMGLARPVDPTTADGERGVWFDPHLDFDHLCRMTAVLDVHDAAALKAVIGERARQLWLNTTRERGLKQAQARADALVDLVLENSSVTATLNLSVPLDVVAKPVGDVCSAVEAPGPALSVVSPQDASAHRVNTLSGRALSDETGGHALQRNVRTSSGLAPSGGTGGRAAAQAPSASPCVTSAAPFGAATVPGVGVIPAEVVSRLAARVGSGFTATLTGAADGRVTTLATTSHAYRPSVGIATLVRRRDGVCRFPYCTASATHADLDHVVPFDQGGPTTATNLQALCRHHHRAKTHGGFTVTMTAEGDCTWASPTGSQWITHPGGVTHAVSVPVRAA